MDTSAIDQHRAAVNAHQDATPSRPSFAEALRFWLKLGFISFGGPTGQIAIMHTELVEKKRWIDESHFLHALNYCMLLPGPEAQQLAIYIGWLLHRTLGGVVAGALFVLPSAFLLWGLSYIYAAHGSVGWIAAVFYGLKPAVMAIVADAVIRIGKKALKNEVMWTLAALAFVAIYFFSVPFPVIIGVAGIVGFAGGAAWPRWFVVIKPHVGGADGEGSSRNGFLRIRSHTRPSFTRAIKVCAACLILWGLPLAIAGRWLGWGHVVVQEGVFFSKAAMVTFGGAYAVLPYVAQQAVEHYGWLGPTQMLDGLGLAETTPGPLIMVVQFVGFLGGWQNPGGLSPLAAATLGAAMTTWVTFVPCFLWILLGAPYVERMRDSRKLSAALSAITAAVVGVVLSLAVWFAIHVLFPAPGVMDGFALGVGLVAFIGLARFKWDIVPVVIGSGLLGVVWRLLYGGLDN